MKFQEDFKRTMRRLSDLDWTPLLVVPTTWRELEHRRTLNGAWYVNDLLSLRVCLSAMVEADGLAWQHLSCSHAARLPRWRELKEAKDVFLGDVYAYQVMPPAKYFVNLHPNVLHLFHCLEGDRPLPEFSKVVGGQRRI